MNKMFNNPDQEYTMPVERAADMNNIDDAVETFNGSEGLPRWACYTLMAASVAVIVGILSIPFWI